MEFSLSCACLLTHGIAGSAKLCVFLPMVLQVLQDYASFSSLQNHASL